MNALYFKEHWPAVKTVLKEKYPALTDNDLAYISGSEDEVIARVESRTGLKREEVEQALLERIQAA